MAEIHWAADASGDFGAGSNWVGGVAPGPGDDAILDAPGSVPYYAQAAPVSGQTTVSSIQLAADASLFVDGSENTFTATNGTGSGANDGLVNVFGGSGAIEFEIGGSFDNVGRIKLSGTSFTGGALAIIGTVTLSGGGKIKLKDTNGVIEDASSASSSTLINVDNAIVGGGYLTVDTLDNEAAGVIEATEGDQIEFEGTGGVNNAGRIKAMMVDGEVGQIFFLTPLNNEAGGVVKAKGNANVVVTIDAAVTNAGVLKAAGGMLILNDPVTGPGQVQIAAGILQLASGVIPNVAFTGKAGTLVLANSQGYTGTVSGFSLTGGTSLDLQDISFVNANEARFVENGSGTGGVLTVTDGTHTANIQLAGDYLSSTFTASSDGKDGTIVVDPAKSPTAVPPADQFISAMAGMSGRDLGFAVSSNAFPPTQPMLVVLSREP